MKLPKENKFSLEYYGSILEDAKAKGYRFMTLRDFVRERPDAQKDKICVLRHDLDDKPQRLMGVVDCEEKLGVKSTVFVLVHTDKYNPFSYAALTLLKSVEARGFEIGLHTNFVEVSQIADIDPKQTLENELTMLRLYFKVDGIACHRNIDFMYNSLPFVEQHWDELKAANMLSYQAYDSSIFGNLVFVNEGFLPHLGWRSNKPEDVLASGKSFCLSTHPHWWHRDNAFEN